MGVCVCGQCMEKESDMHFPNKILHHMVHMGASINDVRAQGGRGGG